MADRITRARPGICKHYRGVMFSDTCEAGVNYVELAGTSGAGWMRLLPCHERWRNANTKVCPHFELPTQEEVEQADRVSRELADLSSEAYRRCAEDAQKRGFKIGGPSVSGKVECPKCGGVLAYSIASSNGHVWAQCQTKCCLRWIQ